MESSGSYARSKSVIKTILQGYGLNRGTRCESGPTKIIYDDHIQCMCRNMLLNTFLIEFGPYLPFLRPKSLSADR